MVSTIEDEELRGAPKPGEAQKAAALAEFEAFEEEWRREREHADQRNSQK